MWLVKRLHHIPMEQRKGCGKIRMDERTWDYVFHLSMWYENGSWTPAGHYKDCGRMTEIPIQEMVKCPLLFDYEPNDLVPAKDCKNCTHKMHVWKDFVNCRYEPWLPTPFQITYIVLADGLYSARMPGWVKRIIVSYGTVSFSAELIKKIQPCLSLTRWMPYETRIHNGGSCRSW